VLYDGSIVKHWYWGNMAFDLETIRLSKNKIPILVDHRTDLRIGYSTGFSKDGKFVLEGKYLKGSEEAERIKRDEQDGFPFEASLRFDPAKTKIQYVREGQTVDINGRKMTGPGTVFTNTTIMEGSVTVFGALANTSAESFVNIDNEREITMFTIESLKAEQPELYGQIFELGKKQGQTEGVEQFKKLMAACGDAELAAKCFVEGKTENEALKMRNECLAKKIAEMQQLQQTSPTQQTPQIQPTQQTKVDPAIAEFADSPEKIRQSARTNESEMTDDQLRQMYANSRQLQEEFGGDGEYIAFVRASRRGQVRILHKN